MTENLETRERERSSQTGTYEQGTKALEDAAAARRISLSKVTNFIWLLFGILEGLIGLRIFLKLIASNAKNPFTNLVYQLTSLFLGPFRDLIGNPTAGGIVLELTSLIALLVYALIGWTLVRLIWFIFRTPT